MPKKRFASTSRSHVLSLRNELLSIKKGLESMDNFFQRIKEARDRLSSVVVFIDKEELIHLVLEALPNEYGAFCFAIRTRNDVVTIEELNTLLNAEERAIKKKSETTDIAKSEQIVIGADPTDRHQQHRPNTSADRMSQGRSSEGKAHFDANVVQSRHQRI